MHHFANRKELWKLENNLLETGLISTLKWREKTPYCTALPLNWSKCFRILDADIVEMNITNQQISLDIFPFSIYYFCYLNCCCHSLIFLLAYTYSSLHSIFSEYICICFSISCCPLTMTLNFMLHTRSSVEFATWTV